MVPRPDGSDSFTSGGAGHLTSRADAASHSRVRSTAPPRTPSMTDPHGATTTFEYDLGGQLMHVTDASGSVVTFTHTSDGQTAAVDYKK